MIHHPDKAACFATRSIDGRAGSSEIPAPGKWGHQKKQQMQVCAFATAPSQRTLVGGEYAFRGLACL
ncbi:Uncharacterized protein HZ326_31273 [Fusarium oxysporum f. sp. albedinis]|nr:Uncharacterized protein HZ326_31273 [Fusarium oxysporum f. sp. albedinis]